MIYRKMELFQPTFRAVPCTSLAAAWKTARARRIPQGVAHEQAGRVAATRYGPPEDDAVGGVRRDARVARRHRRLRHRRFGVHGCAGPVPARRHPLHLGCARAGRRPHGRRLLRASPVATACASRRTVRASRTSSRRPPPRSGRIRRSSCITPETGSATLGLGGFQETEQLPIFSQDHQVPGARQQQGAHGRADRRARSTARMLEMGPTQLNIPRDFFYGDIECEIPRRGGDRSRRRRRAQPRRSGRAARVGAVPGDHRRRRHRHGGRPGRSRRARGAAAGAGGHVVPAQRRVSRRSIRCGAARSAIRAARPR